MNLLSIAPFNVNPWGTRRGKPFFLTAIILLGVFSLAVALLTMAWMGPGSVAAQSQDPANYDANGNDLIEVTTLAQLNAIRWDMDGNGVPMDDASTTEVDETQLYADAFPVAAGGSVCPAEETCEGYELVADLDFDTGVAGDRTDDTYYNDATDDGQDNGQGWVPIGDKDTPFTATFDGKDHTISNLYINSSAPGAVGLFGGLGAGEKITRLRLADVNVTSSGDPPGFDPPGTGGLVGNNFGEINYSSVTGRVTREGSPSSTNDGAVGELGSLTIVGGLVGENQGGIAASYAAVAVSGYNSSVGGLVGQNHSGGTITSSYAVGKVRGDGGNVGGLVGDNLSGRIISSYASGDVTGLGDSGFVGGLVGRTIGHSTINASYSTSVVSSNGGLTGFSVATSIPDSYWDTETSSVSTGEKGKTTAELQMPTNETVDTGIYATWDKDIWDFGTASQYPSLKADLNDDGMATWQEFGCQVRERPQLTVKRNKSGTEAAVSWTTVSAGHCTPSPTIKYALYRREGNSPWLLQGNPSTATEDTDSGLNPQSNYSYQVRVLVNDTQARRSNVAEASYVPDSDGNGLIEIATLEQLNVIRFDLDGDAVVSSENESDYRKAFGVTVGISCPADKPCEGYELVADLDFDTGVAGDRTDDTYYNDATDDGQDNGQGWVPIGDKDTPFTATFDGKDHTISNLYINSSAPGAVGLFGGLGAGEKITRLRLADVNVTSSGDPPGFDPPGTGGLVGNNFGEINYSSVTGRVTREGSPSSTNDGAVGELGSLTIVGGLVGENQGGIAASYAAVAVSGYNSSVGGLVGQNHSGGTITSSYAVGKVRGDGGNVGGLVGDNLSGRIISSYASGDVTGLGDSGFVGGLVGRTIGHSTINASYSTSVVSSNGGLTGFSVATSIPDSYWDTETSSVSTGEKGKTTAELQMPTNETVDTGIYATWDKDIWDFGTASQYPSLKADLNDDGMATWQEFGCQVRERPQLTVEIKEGGAVAQLSWTTVSAGHCTPSPTIKYALYRREGQASQFEQVPQVPSTATEYTDRTLDPQYRYSYQVRVLVDELPARASNIVKVKSGYFMDVDGDGLIEIANLAQLNAIRFDPNGDGVPSPGDADDYRAAFEGIEGNVLCSGPCRGYELVANLDFDENGDGEITVADAAYWNAGAGWKPIDYDAVFEGNGYSFEGNGYSISNLYINGSSSTTDMGLFGLFGRLGSGGLISQVKLVDVDVAASGDSSSVGGLVGQNDGGTIAGSDVSGEIAATGAKSSVGSLVGRSDAGRITGNYASGTVSGAGAGAASGGLVGLNAGGIVAGSYAASSVLGSADAKGGLVGKNDGGTIIAAYATGSVNGGGGLVGENLGGTIIATYSTGVANGGLVATNSVSVTNGISSYWDTWTSGALSSAGGRVKTTAELQAPTGYTGIYASWNVDIDDADGDGDPFTGGDNPWIFGGSGDYPTLNLAALRVLPGGDRAVLAELYEATNGSGWTSQVNWLSDEPIGSWEGVLTNVNGQVTRLTLRQNNLVGTIPVSLGNLAALEILDLGDNSLKGVIPAHFGNLANLKVLALDRNTPKNKLPDAKVEGNGLSGNIPPQLGRLSNLGELALSDNNLRGAVPEELGNLRSLLRLALHNNSELSGPLPSSFTSLSALEALHFFGTGLCAPSSLRQWSGGLESFTGPYCE